jgi:hypothetical protein
MNKKDKDIQPDISAAIDRGDVIGLMEPMLVSESSRDKSALADLALELATEATALKNSLPKGILHPLADLVRAMNCYYSNLIEGHNTHPVDIERALKENFSTDIKKRNLQREAAAGHPQKRSGLRAFGLLFSF